MSGYRHPPPLEHGILVLLVLTCVVAIVGVAAELLRSPGDDWQDAALALVEDHEGYRQHIYTGPAGETLVGYGTDLSQGVTKGEASYLARGRLVREVATLRRLWPAFDAQPAAVQAALGDMAYALGGHGVHDFEEMLAALARGDRDEAARQALASQWGRRYHTRAAADAALIRGD